MATYFQRFQEQGASGIPSSPFQELLGLKVTAVEPGRAILELPVTPRLLNTQGVVHGGAISTLADTAMGVAAWTQVDAGSPFATLDLRVSFLKPVRSGKLVATAVAVRSGRSVQFLECAISNERGAAIARASMTLMQGRTGATTEPSTFED